MDDISDGRSLPLSLHNEQREQGILIGNQVDKSELSNPIARAMVENFDNKLMQALHAVQPSDIHEVGCGEARITPRLAAEFDVPVLASDFSKALIAENKRLQHPSISFEQTSIYHLRADRHRRDVVVCCEVLEHLEEPEKGLAALKELNARAYVLSVPREPLWCALNFLRGKYMRDWGNTPGHLNHWSARGFIRFLEEGGFQVESVLNPTPWVMVRATVV